MDPSPARPREPDEDEFPWLTILLDALQLLDEGLSREVAAGEQRRGVRVGCHAGCTACCQSNVRLRPIEIEGIAWYAATRLDEDTWRRVKAQLSGPEGATCPFLLDGQCSVRPLRPLTCRTFFVFGQPCRVGERLLETRLGDVFEHSDALAERVALRLFDDTSFGLRSDDEKRAAYQRGVMYMSALRMQHVDWVVTIDALRDARRGGERAAGDSDE
jgi:uncharacterized protein